MVKKIAAPRPVRGGYSDKAPRKAAPKATAWKKAEAKASDRPQAQKFLETKNA